MVVFFKKIGYLSFISLQAANKDCLGHNNSTQLFKKTNSSGYALPHNVNENMFPVAWQKVNCKWCYRQHEYSSNIELSTTTLIHGILSLYLLTPYVFVGIFGSKYKLVEKHKKPIDLA